MITIQLLGGACLRSGDAALAGPPAQRHRIALLALVVASWPQPLSRDRAMALLWPERDLAHGRRLLNLAVHVLRNALGEGVITSTGSGLLLDPSRVRCDLHDLRAAIAADASERVVRLYTGPLLDGFHLSDSTDFGYWLDDRRNELSHAYVGALLSVAEHQGRSGDVHGRVGTRRRLVAADPYSGTYAQALMHALDAAGDRAGATRHAGEHADRLRVDLELEPDPDVTALAERLRAAPRPHPVPISPVRALGPAVAVLPFLNLSADAENEYFADGITEDVIAHLSKVRALKVISRTSVMPFKERKHTLEEIGRTLGVASMLDGSVRRAGGRVRIVAKLIDIGTDEHRWAETYDREMTDIFSIQTDVALQIAAALEAELTPDENTRVRREPTRDIQAYELFLRGRRWLIEYTPSALARAIEYFDRAIERDPAFALAMTDLAMAYIELAEQGFVDPEVAHARAAESAARALSLDPELGAAHCTVGYLNTMLDFDWSGAEQSFKRALELSPSNADAHDLYGRLCAALERHDEAIALAQRAQELDPLAHRMDATTALLRAGRYAEAVDRAEAAVALDPDHSRARATLGWAYFLSGRQDEGVAELEQAGSGGNTLWLGQLGQAYAMSGREPEARRILLDFEERAREAYVSPYHFAYIHTGLGEVERALDCLEQALASRAGPVFGIKGSFLFTRLHGHPRFQSLLEEMNLGE